jgi:cytochrome b561
MNRARPSTPSPPKPRHSRVTIALHWASALAIAAAFALGWWREASDDPPLRSALLLMHSQTGLIVLSLLIARIWPRLHAHATRPDGPGSVWQRRAAAAVHVLLYLLLLAQPLLGWALANARGHAVTLFGVLLFPTLVAVDPDLADSLADIHETVAWGLLALVGAHAAAALWHHFVVRDGVLDAMSPRALLARRPRDLAAERDRA